MREKIDLVEVGLRDGLQNDPSRLSTDQKLDFMARLIKAGVKRMEAASFVHPKLVPSMADSETVMKRAPRDQDVSFIGLALNERGVERALAAHCDEINYVMSAGEGFGIKNQNMTPFETAERFEHIAPGVLPKGVPVSVTISAAFGDPYDGEVPLERVVALAERAAKAGASEIALGDTIGVATPKQVLRCLEAVRPVVGKASLRIHFHNTRNTALANIYAALEAGIRVIDASCGGIGGCPFAPKATGNVATEDVVYMLERDGLDTGLDLDELIRTAAWLEKALEHAIPSMLAKAGPFPPYQGV